jgi:predicted ribosome quality control (RQC) complex YloA/Tae2 family protein
MRYPCLSFLELQRFHLLLAPSLQGARVDRVFVPECVEHPQGFFKNEFVLETRNGQFLISLRSQACGVAYLPPKTLRPTRAGTRSGFDLSLSKTLVGTRIESASLIDGERVLILTFSGDPEFQLFLNLQPSLPEGTLVSEVADDQTGSSPSFSLIASSRNRSDFTPPSARHLSGEALAKIPDRVELVASLQDYSALWMHTRLSEALNLRQQKILSHLKHQQDAIERKIRSLDQQEKQSQDEPDWNQFGMLLQTHLYSNPVLKNHHYSLFDYEKEVEVLVPGDAKLSPKQQLEKFFHLAKRSRKRTEESQQRKVALSEKKNALMRWSDQLLNTGPTLDALLQAEHALGLGTQTHDRDSNKKIAGYSGKIYRSQEGLVILSGRSKDENLELTFKVARGNDLWLHVKGRPGSHTVILLPPNKTASLETLLDAANLCILHSGGKDWGKTEVDYTPRKYVKKIKNQTEVSYSANKTLVVTLDHTRLKRLYGENES